MATNRRFYLEMKGEDIVEKENISTFNRFHFSHDMRWMWYYISGSNKSIFSIK